MDNIVHILYSGIGGQAGVCFSLARASACEARHSLAFYGVEKVADKNASEADALGLRWKGFRKGSGLDLKAQREMAEWMLGLDPDVVIAHSPATLYACRLVRKERPSVRILAVEHHPNALKSLKRWILSAVALRVADAVVYLSEEYRLQVRKRLGPLFRSKRSTVIPNGLDLSLYSEACGSGDDGTHIIGMQGRMVSRKYFRLLLDAFAALRAERPDLSLRLELAGDGPDRADLESLARDLNLGDDVVFHGFLSSADLVQRMKNWDVFALATEGETMSVSLMEAQAMGLAIVASDVAGVGSFIRDGETGVLVAEHDSTAWSRALTEVISKPEYRKQLGKQARRAAQEQLSIENSWSGYKRLIQSPSSPQAGGTHQETQPATIS